MLRKIIKIDESKCNGCGACASACHEGAIAMVNGVAKLTREDYCDGLGDCLPACPTGAITFETREAPAYDEAAVKKAQLQKKLMQELGGGMPCGCPGSQAKVIKHENADAQSGSVSESGSVSSASTTSSVSSASSVSPVQAVPSRLSTWPVQIKLAPVNAPYFSGADLLIAADCSAYAYGNFHNDLIKNRVVLIGCPKLDEGDYSEKLKAIIAGNDIKSVTVVRMEVPCCGGIEMAARRALQESEKFIPWQIVTISTDGRVLD